MNSDQLTIKNFGEEWNRFDQSSLTELEQAELFELYFKKFPWQSLPHNAVGLDVGCGSGRWAKLVAPKVGKLHCLDASNQALSVAKSNLRAQANCIFHHATVEDKSVPDNSMDFGYSLGVLHHLPNPKAGLEDCVKKLKPGAPFLLYLYYRFDNRPWWFRMVWQVSDFLRKGISKLPERMRYLVCDLLAAVVYFPLAKFSKALSSLGINSSFVPLSFYKDRSFYTMRTDSLDRFGTRLEFRFTKQEITVMMNEAGLMDVEFNATAPYWVAVGRKSVSLP